MAPSATIAVGANAWRWEAAAEARAVPRMWRSSAQEKLDRVGMLPARSASVARGTVPGNPFADLLGAAVDAGRAAPDHPFADLLNTAVDGKGAAPGDAETVDVSLRDGADTNEELHRSVDEMLARALVAPVLASLQNDPLKSDLFEGTHAEKALRPLLEAQVAQSVVQRLRTGLGDAVARRLRPSESQVQPV